MKHFLRVMLISITIFFLTTIAALYVLQDSMIFPSPATRGAVYQENGFRPVSIHTPDGESLASFYRPPETIQPTILVFHGNGDAAAYQQSKANQLAKSGFGVLLVEYRGYGGSSGVPSESGLYIDGMAAYDFVRQQSSQPIGLYAHSLGSGVAVLLATKRKIFALVLESPFDSLMAVAKRRFPWVPVSLLLKHKFQSDLLIGKIDAPILLIHGSDDRVIPIGHGKKLAEKAPFNTRFEEIAGAGHNNLQQFGSVDMAVEFFKSTE